MMRLALAFVLVSIASSASAQTSAPTPAPQPASLVFVYDGGGARVSGDRVRRALAALLARPVLRLTDEGAATAVGRLTIAYSPPDHWVIDFVRGDVHTTRTISLRTSTVSALARVAATVVNDVDPAAAPVRAAPAAQRSEWIALIGDEILDPFVGQPTTRRRHALGVRGELVDPFGHGAGSSWRGYDDVIDPWSH
jgi:hypothetical protein